MRLPKSVVLTSAYSGLQLDLEIALSGVSAKVQPLGLIQPCRRCVETSGDVIGSVSGTAQQIVEHILQSWMAKTLQQCCFQLQQCAKHLA